MSEETLHTPKNPLATGVTRPVSVWNRPLKVDFPKLFKTLTVGIINGVTAQWGAAANDLFDSIDAVKLKDDPGQLLWLLIVTAMQRALVETTNEYLPDLNLAPGEDPGAFANTFADAIEAVDCTLDASFMDHPGRLDLLEPVADAYQHWLHGLGMSESESQTIAARLRPHFVFTLHKTWRDNPNRYAPILRELDTPFAQASQEEHSWLKYAARLERKINKSVFGEVFGLEQIFIPLHAYYVESEQPRQNTLEVQKRQEKEIRHVVRLEECIDHWLKTSGKDDAIRMISGGPGAGKSSFCRMYAANVARRDRRVLLIPLHRLSLDGNLLDDVRRFAREGLELRGNVFSSEGPPTLVIFDGLDEVSMHGDVGESVARTFCEKASAMVTELNTAYHKVHLLISGRVLAVQAGENRIQNAKHTLHLLPYAMASNERNSHDYKDPDELLRIDLRNAWWSKLGACTGENFSDMPEELKRKDLDPITTEPLLNYLVARVYRKQEIDLTNNISLNKIYALLLHDVYERRYEQKRKLIRESELSEAEFIRALEDVALAVWQSDGRKATIEKLKAFVNEKILERLGKDVAEGAGRLMVTFFFRAEQEGALDQRTFEFTHKSFGEYLAARRLLRAVVKTGGELRRFQEDSESGWSPTTCLGKDKWSTWFARQPMTEEICAFLRSEVKLQKKENNLDVEVCQDALTTLLNHSLRHGPGVQEAFPDSDFRTLYDYARHVDITLLTALNACACTTQNVSSIQWPGPTDFARWFSWLTGPSGDNIGALARKNVSYINLTEQSISDADLSYADLSYADLSYADLSYANLSHANLCYANLCYANLCYANLCYANLCYANLSHANLCYANLSHANLSDTDLGLADLKEAYLRGADLRGANLDYTDLRGADLGGANLTEANLKETDLRGAYLPALELKGGYLPGLDPSEACLEKTKFSKSSCEELERMGIDLSNVEFCD